MSDSLLLAKPLTLPCGLVLPNRLAKAAMAEGMAPESLPTPAQFARSYGAWADGGWGMVLSGNVQVDIRYLGQPSDAVLDPTRPAAEMLAAFRELAAVCRRGSAPTLLQLNHPGRQSPLGCGTKRFWDKNPAPSAVPIDFGSDWSSWVWSRLFFGVPREMSAADIEDLVERFAYAARVASEAGFDGIQLHGAHGYLLAQFLSPKTNRRTDAYGGSPAARVKVVVDIIKAIRAVTPPTFAIGLKLNSADHQTAGDPDSTSELNHCLEQATIAANAGLDFLEISGGTYEKPLMMTGHDDEKVVQSKRTAARESYFLGFAKALRQNLPDTVLMVTGGFRTRLGMEAALEEGACDIVGLGRPAVLNPSLPVNTILNPEVPDEDAKVYAKKIQTPYLYQKLSPKSIIGAGYETAWYERQIRSMS